MPNIRLTFPGSSSRPTTNTDDQEDEDQPQSVNVGYHGGAHGKQLRVGGKQMMRPQEDDDDDDDDSEDDSEEDEEEETNHQYNNEAARGLGKQLRPATASGGGKYLRPAAQGDEEEDSEEEDDDSEEEEEPAKSEPVHDVVRPAYRGGGKNLLRMPQPEEDEEEDDSEEEEESENEQVEPPAPADSEPAYHVVPRGGGKSLMRMQPPPQESEDDDDESLEDDDEEEEEAEPEPPKPAERAPSPSVPEPPPAANKAPPASVASVAVTTISRSPGGGKQLRRPEPEQAKQLPEPPPKKAATTIVSRSPAGGKQLRRPEPEPTPSNKADTKAISRSPAGGKQLRRPEPEEEEKPPEPSAPPKAEPKKAEQVAPPSSRTGKVLRRPTPKEEEEEESEEEEEEEEPDDDDDDEDFEVSVKAKPKKPATRGVVAGKGGRKKKQIEEESEESEVEDDKEFFGDDEVSSDEEQELDINNTEALIKDEADRKYLDSLPELEREAILGERFEKLKAEQDMKKAIREAKLKEAEKTKANDLGTVAAKKRPAPAKKVQPAKKAKGATAKRTTDGDEELARKLTGRRESARDRDANKAKSKKAAALAALKKEKKSLQQKADDSSEDSLDFGDDDDDDSDDDYEESGGLKPWQQKQKEKATKPRVSGLDKDEDSDDDAMETDEDEVPKQSAARASDKISAPVLEADLEDFIKVTIPRRRLSRWCNEPFFNAAVLECFVRLFIGEDDSGEKVYRLCEIVDITTGPKSYKFPVANKNEKPVSTSKMMRLKFGKSEKDFPMILISDAPPTEVDVQKYLTNQKNNRMEVLTKRRANKLRRLQDNLVNNYTYTNEDIERNLQARKKQGNALANLGLEQTKIAIVVQAARDSLFEAERRLTEAKTKLVESGESSYSLEESVRDAEKAVNEAKEMLKEKENEEQALNSKAEDRKRRLTKRRGDVDWAKVNERAVQINQRVDREALKIKQGPSVAGSGKKEGEFNPYARRKVKPKILWEVGQGKVEEKQNDDVKCEEKKGSREDAAKEDFVDTPNLIHEPSEKAPAFSESHQFAIDEEYLAQSSLTSGLGMSSKSHSNPRIRKGLSLSAYLEQKATGTL